MPLMIIGQLTVSGKVTKIVLSRADALHNFFRYLHYFHICNKILMSKSIPFKNW